MRVLGIETSCDETAAAVVERQKDGNLRLLSNIVASSVDLHAAYGGVVPEIAARSHLERINPVITQALKSANAGWSRIDAIAATHGPGLGGSLLVGVLTARTLAIIHKKPLLAVNHVEAHVYGALFDNRPDFPMLALIVSGGHSHLVLFKNHFDYTVLGRTLDDAVGEAFDKVAKILGLPYPGGPSIEKAAESGDPNRYLLPLANLESPYDFSFSGLKTAVLRTAQKEVGKDYTFPSHKIAGALTKNQRKDVAASFQKAALEALVVPLEKACREFKPKSIVVAGGVAASKALRSLADQKLKTSIVYPPIELCTDNGAMIAANAVFQLEKDRQPSDPYLLDSEPSLKM